MDLYNHIFNTQLVENILKVTVKWTIKTIAEFEEQLISQLCLIVYLLIVDSFFRYVSLSFANDYLLTLIFELLRVLSFFYKLIFFLCNL